MKDRKVAVRNAKVGYVAIVGMLIINIMLASFIFFDMGIPKVREMFIAMATLMLLIYSVVYPTKLLPSGSYLLRAAVFMMLPHILIQLISTPSSDTIAIVAYIINIVISVFCAYMCIGYHAKAVKYISTENYNDYVLFEYNTFKAQEINIYSFAFLFINFFIMQAGGNELSILVLCYINLLVAITLNFYRTRVAKSDKVKMSYYALESLSSFLAYTVVAIVNFLNLTTLIYLAAIALLVPTIVMTIYVYRSLDHFMYK